MNIRAFMVRQAKRLAYIFIVLFIFSFFGFLGFQGNKWLAAYAFIILLVSMPFVGSFGLLLRWNSEQIAERVPYVSKKSISTIGLRFFQVAIVIISFINLLATSAFATNNLKALPILTFTIVQLMGYSLLLLLVELITEFIRDDWPNAEETPDLVQYFRA